MAEKNKLSEHFSLWELTHSAIAQRHGVSNKPDELAIRNLTRVAEEILEPVRRNFQIPFSPSSGFRCPELNRLVGSGPRSQHITGHAVDFEIPAISNWHLAGWMKDNLMFDQLILEFYHPDDPHSGWVHCSYRAENNRRESLIFNGQNYKEF